MLNPNALEIGICHKNPKPKQQEIFSQKNPKQQITKNFYNQQRYWGKGKVDILCTFKTDLLADKQGGRQLSAGERGRQNRPPKSF